MTLELYDVILLVLIVFVLLLTFLLFLRFTFLEKHFNPLKFKVVNEYIFDQKHHKDFIKFTIYNANLNDARITAFGYYYRQKNIDYVNDFIAQKQLGLQPVVIPSREAIIFNLPLENLVDHIQDINGGHFKMRRIVAYATSSHGQKTFIYSSPIRHHLQRALRVRLKLARARIAQIRRENRKIWREKVKHNMQLFFQKTKFFFSNLYQRLTKARNKAKP